MKTYRHTFLILVGFLLTSSVFAQQPNHEKEIKALLAKMTLEEKIGQLSQPVLKEQNDSLFSNIKAGKVGSFCVIKPSMPTPAERNRLQKIAVEESRLGIPIIFGYDVIHGFTTIFPTPLGTSASWDTDMAERAANIAATEARHYGMDLAFSPMVDVSRDPRWGRISECYGEDVYLNAQFGKAVVKGYQGTDLTQPNTIGACLKHFVGYGIGLGGRDKQFCEISHRSLLETYLPPFEACIKAGAVSVMTAFNDVSGVPSTANPYTLTDVLKKEWGFDGFTLSDWDAVIELRNHGIAGTDQEAAELALNAGTDMEMKSNSYQQLIISVKTGKVKMRTINDAVKRVLRIKYRLGLFSTPYINEQKAQTIQTTAAHRALARTAAAESMVLIKNNGVLPLSKSLTRIAIKGPFAHSHDQYGWWQGYGNHQQVVTPYQGLLNNKPSTLEIVHETRSNNRRMPIIMCVGEPGRAFGESNCTTDISFPKAQLEAIKAAKSTGSKVIVVVYNGRPLILTEVAKYADAILLAWHSGTEAGNALADVLFGKTNPSGKLTCTFPQTSGQIPIYYSDRTSGRPHEDRYSNSNGKPLYPFGYGLSYTSFSYQNLRLKSSTVTTNGTITAMADITNTGKHDGKEVVQLYLHDKVATITRPQKELKAFQKIHLKAGETKTVEFQLPVSDLAFYNAKFQKVVEPGQFDLWISESSEKGLHTTVTVTP